ncbi:MULTISPECIES: sensor domain-containing diguanylate cyclase [unclassified Colwellia]|uniref:sensor domain-containing diguanylate cyclase n=1 Tax=unclassified Colwellia TaxID=196834 RepID=UPI0015F40AAB|nr:MULTISPECIES: sensor domain-containing diguanylate cyclase [unclassified Colwellia]MBA6350630.1 sensor domain-containing diguanylate cyclase [Colwellia sp. BRX9-1]MBA6357720.1 sensor domain-containing diguanylate cyclase [Colwellia sp. BRX8-3]MBA6361514.1 sensor domain-containing diguanylate cyclase [Colwellia sp. BRX8-6]MBA6369564.1 sensor domain-containing diguanylate cyclase [Colwellia sp. BRX8-5]MBA6376140.1 sensor domain-containing diguanylate cyclase [Colwellia sp. BRX8-2]
MDLDKFKQINKAFDYLFDSLVITDLQGIITDWNKGSENLYGYSKKEIIGQPVDILHLPEDTEHITSEVISSVEKYGKWTGEVRMLHKDGHIGWIESMCVPLFDANHKLVGALGVNRDISDRVKETKRLEHLAHYDQLTEIPNRYLVFDRIDHLIDQSERDMRTFALLFIDLDKFKIINDTKGHAFGDQVLVEVSLRLKQSIRNSDTVARIGGDEFVILLENMIDKSNVDSVIKTIMDTISRPFKINDEKLTVSCSIGVSIYPDDGITTDSLIATADKAMYNNKHKK